MDRSLALNPRNAAAHFNRANLLRDMGRLNEALNGYGAALAVNPGNSNALTNQGGQDIFLNGRHGLGAHTRLVSNAEYLSSIIYRRWLKEKGIRFGVEEPAVLAHA